MLPSANCNLAKYLEDVVKSPDTRTFLLEFFGCLSRGLWHMHRQRLWHRDIKPENILILHNKVFLAGFGCSHNWFHTLHSTTEAVPPRTNMYASPEVARFGFVEHREINGSSDIWSLGCVFLEIVTAFSGLSVRDLDVLRKSCYCNNIEEIHQWIEELREIDTRPSVNVVLDQIQGMLLETPESRPTAHKLVEKTSDICCFACRMEDSGHLI
jgi:serine/threonine protein kinase